MSGLLTLKESSALTLSAVEDLVAERGRKAIRPIYRNKGLRPEQLGTCTFVEIDGSDYLLTAAHVVDNHERHTLFVGQGSLAPVTMTFHSTVAPAGNRLRDKIDFAFAKVDRSWRAKGVLPLPIGNLVDREDALIYSAIGYPNSRNRRYNPVKHTVRPTIRQFISTPVNDLDAFRSVGLHPDINLALRRTGKYAQSGGRRVPMFEPRGMSGGMIFGLYGMSRPGVIAGLDEPLIVPEAIITEKNIKHQLLFGTRLIAIVEKIRSVADRR